MAHRERRTDVASDEEPQRSNVNHQELYDMIVRGGFPNEQQSKEALDWDYIQEERMLFTDPGLVERLLIQVETGGTNSAALALHCLKTHSATIHVQERLQAAWGKADEVIKCHLMWRITDNERLAPKFKAEMLLWALNHYSVWRQFVLEFFKGDSDAILKQNCERVLGGPYPEPHKAWLPLLTLPVSDRQDAVWTFIETCSITDDFSTHVRTVILELHHMGWF